MRFFQRGFPLSILLFISIMFCSSFLWAGGGSIGIFIQGNKYSSVREYRSTKLNEKKIFTGMVAAVYFYRKAFLLIPDPSDEILSAHTKTIIIAPQK